MPTPTATPPTRGIDPQALLAIRDLELRARVVEGLRADFSAAHSSLKAVLRFLIAVGLGLLWPMARAESANITLPAPDVINGVTFNHADLGSVLSLLAEWSGRNINMSRSVSGSHFADPGHWDPHPKSGASSRVGNPPPFEIFGHWGPIPRSEAVAELQRFLEKAGIVFDQQPDGSLQVSLIGSIDPQAWRIIFHQVKASVLLEDAYSWAGDRKIDASNGVLKSATLIDVAFHASNRGEATAQILDALEKQAGIIATSLPDGTLQLRLKTGENAPVVVVPDLIDALKLKP
jgi:hypothetical protein